jgi:hypothetical protein
VDLTTFSVMLGICAVLIAFGYALGKRDTKGNEAADTAPAPTFENYARDLLGKILDRLVRIEMSFNDHPTRQQVEDMIEKAISEHEYHVHKMERRK